jgi:hypothetical protein
LINNMTFQQIWSSFKVRIFFSVHVCSIKLLCVFSFDYILVAVINIIVSLTDHVLLKITSVGLLIRILPQYPPTNAPTKSTRETDGRSPLPRLRRCSFQRSNPKGEGR